MDLSLPVLLTLLLAMVSPWWVAGHRASFVIVGGLLHLGHAGYYLGRLVALLGGGERVEEKGVQFFPTPLIEWTFIGTAWGLMFAVLITGIGLLVFLFSAGYFGDSVKGHRFFVPLLAFEASMLGLVLADHAILVFLFWELTSVTSFFLIGFLHHQTTSRWNAQQALLVTGGGGVCLLAGFIMLGVDSGTLSLDAWREMAFAGMSPSIPVLVLLLLGAATKSALFPFFFWLPNAMSAPTPVSSYLHSATMVKAGIFLIGALFPVFASSQGIMQVIMIMGGLTAVTGLALGWVQTNLKKILAYTTLSILGMLAFLLGLGGKEAIMAAVLLLVAHACYKAGLFMAAGGVDKAAGTLDLRKLGGMWKSAPGLALAAGGLAFSAMGVPPLLGFLAKEYAYNLGFPEGAVVWAVALFLFLFNVVMMVLILRVAWHPFHGKVDEGGEELALKKVPLLMMTGPVVLLMAGVVLGIGAPFLLTPLVNAVVGGMIGEPYVYGLKLWAGFTPALMLSAATLIAGWFLFKATRAEGHANPLSRGLGFAEGTYTWLFHGLMKGSAWVSGKLQNGDLRTYLQFFFVGLLFLVGLKWWHSGSDILLLVEGAPKLPVMESLLVPAMALGILLVMFTKSRLSAVLGLAVIGLGMAFLFARLGAPDVALTLILVEALTVVLFIYIVYGLPKIRTITPLRGRLLDGLISVSVGLVMAVLALQAQELQLKPTISTALTEWSYTLAKGKNVVNVILVDFRALDTLGEITVVALAAVGVFLIWARKAEDVVEEKTKEGES